MPEDPSYTRRMALLDAQIESVLATLDATTPLLHHMGRYALGLANTQGENTDGATRARAQGKRIRPQIAMMVAEAVGGSAESAAPVAAAIELLHNFTLVHDDIQDRSPNRRHRPTIWRVWGDAQAINAGDAIFALAQLSLLDCANTIGPNVLTELIRRFNTCTIDIVRGQVQDLDNEGSASVTADDYLEMIGGKTAAILGYSAWGGAIVGGADTSRAEQLAELGYAIGLGFQIRDDMLGIWSPVEETGKDAADDLRRRKQTLPVLILRDRANDEDKARISTLYQHEEMSEDTVQELLALLEKYDVRAATNEHVAAEHQRAIAILDDVFGESNHAAVSELRMLITRLVDRSY